MTTERYERPTRPPRPPASSQDAELIRLGQVAGELLHDLGGILTVLGGRVALAREEAELGRIPTDELRRIQGDSDELRRMVLDILDELRGVRPSLESTFPVNRTLESVVNRWLVGAPPISTTFRSSLAPDASLSGPRSFFTRVIGNLLKNAARHARREIRLTARPGEAGQWVEIRVEDDGDGIADEVRARLFQPFVSTADTGMGLGLSFARWSVERLGGSLMLEANASGLGGASFQVLLPLATIGRNVVRSPTVPYAHGTSGGAPTPIGREQRLAESGPLQDLRIAIVEDDAAVRRTFARRLHQAGAHVAAPDVTTIKSPDEVARILGDEVPLDVILLDIHLSGLSGLDIYRVLCSELPELSKRVLFLTGGIAPEEALDRPLVNKMTAWANILTCILQVRDSGTPDD